MLRSLRKNAETLLKQNPLETPLMDTVEVQQLVHELQAHQIELEMKNEELRQSQAELSSARDAYVELYECAPVGYLTLDPIGRIYESNLAAAALLGIDGSKLMVGRTFSSFVHRDSLQAWDKHRLLLAKELERVGIDLVLNRSSGELRTVRVECMPRLNENREIERYLVILTDFTPQVTAEKKFLKSEGEWAEFNLQLEQLVDNATTDLRESETRFRGMFEQMVSGAVIYEVRGDGAEFVFKDVNAAAERIAQFKKEDAVGRSFQDVFPTGDESVFVELFRRVWKTGEPEMISSALYEDDRIQLWADNSAFRLPSGEVVSIFNDLTAQKQAEQEVEKSHRLLRSVIDTMHDHVWWKDLNSVFLGCSLNVAKDAGFEHPDQLIGKTDHDLSWKEQADYFVADDREVVESGNPKLGIQESLTQADGTTRWIETNKTLLHDNAGKIIGTVGTYADITERKRMNEALEKRVIALTRPLDGEDFVAFEELFNLEDIQRMQDEFALATGVTSLICRPDGSSITEPSNCTDFCLKVVRETEMECANCIKSGVQIGRHQPEGRVIQTCQSTGLWYAGASIEVGGRHIANWLIGQVRDETQTDEQMCAYAREIGADEKAFTEAFLRVPAMSREHFEEVAQALFTLANQLSTSAYQNVQQARFIEDQKRTEQALKESEEKYRLVFESEFDAILIFDGETRRFLDVNHAAVELYGYALAEFLQLTHWEISAGPERLDGVVPAELSPATFESWHRKKDGTVFPVEITPCTFSLKGRPVFCGVVRDISERVAREEEINHNREDLRHLASELSLAGQHERKRIATELHDGVSQFLSSSYVQLSALKETVLPEGAVQSLDKISDALHESLQQIRTLTFELNCPMLTEQGLAAALEGLCSSMTSEQSARFEFHGAAESLFIPFDQEVMLFRSVRELLNNVMKHSGAQCAHVKLDRDGDHVRISVKDDGRGVDVALVGKGFSRSGGFGLFSIREHIQHTGGRLEIKSAPGAGTEIVLSVPLEATDEQVEEF